MFSVALIGADGAGKTTIARRLERTLPLPARYVYMGINLESSNVMLPSTRLIVEVKRALGGRPDLTAGPPRADVGQGAGGPAWKRSVKGALSTVRMVNQIAEEFYRHALIRRIQRNGCIALTDRFFFADYYAWDVAPTVRPRSALRRAHGFMLDRVYPRPDLVILLHAPPEALHARKREGTLESLERRQNEYLALRGLVPRFEIVDASRAEDIVLDEVARRILAFHGEWTASRIGPLSAAAA